MLLCSPSINTSKYSADRLHYTGLVGTVKYNHDVNTKEKQRANTIKNFWVFIRKI